MGDLQESIDSFKVSHNHLGEIGGGWGGPTLEAVVMIVWHSNHRRYLSDTPHPFTSTPV